MADDPYLTWDGAYVLGALTPDDRQAFERHLVECDACTRRVQALAGLPGLLARADRADLETASGPVLEAPPATLLPRLLDAARRERSRRRWLTGSGWAAAAVAAALAVVFFVVSREPADPAPAAAADFVALTPVGNEPLTGEVSLTGVTWGTKIVLKCLYPPDGGSLESYQLVVVDRGGMPHAAGDWKIVPGKEITMNASTAVPATDIGAVHVLLDGRTVLTHQF